MTDLFEEPEDATPLTPDERQGLIPSDITYRRELNKAEQENITRAQDWALARHRDLLTEKYVKELHRRMLGEAWRWAGAFRTIERNIGIPPHQIPTTLRDLMRLGQARFGWGSANLQDAGGIRQRYIEALKAADNHDIQPLLAFARS